MRSIGFLAIALVSCATASAPIRVFTYNSSTSFSEPTIIEIVASHGIVAAGALDLRTTSSEQRSLAAYQALLRAQAYAESNGLNVTAPPLLINRLITAERWEFEVALPISTPEEPTPASEGVIVSQTPSGLAIALDHAGPTDTLQASYETLAEAAPDGTDLLPLTWEQYLTDPITTAPEQQRARIFRQLRAYR